MIVKKSIITAIATLSLTASPSFAQSGRELLPTCRAVLENGDFIIAETGQTGRCCFVSDEQSWYAANDVRLNRLYRVGDLITYTEQCEGAVSGASSPDAIDSRTTSDVNTQAGSPNGGGIDQPAGAGNNSNAGEPQASNGNAPAGNAGNGGGEPQDGGHSQPGGESPANPSNGNGQGDQGGNGNGQGSQGGNGNGSGSNGQKGQGNNGFGNGGGDGSPNGMQDETR